MPDLLFTSEVEKYKEVHLEVLFFEGIAHKEHNLYMEEYTMKMYAGIGSRQTPANILEIMYLSAKDLARKSYICNTGACKGADQAFANGAIEAKGQVQLFVPWPSYEKNWWTNKSNTTIHVLQANDVEAFNSVKQFHPASQNLSQAVSKLHARNFCIIRGVQFIICWTPNGQITGGTGQALRIAENYGIIVYNLGNQQTLAAFKKALGI